MISSDSNHWVYLSHFYNELTPGYGGKKNFSLQSERSIACGDKCNQFQMTIGNHVGTHIDLPYHFYEQGKKLNDYSPESWFFRHIFCLEIAVKNNQLIFPSDLFKTIPQETQCLLLKTGFEKYRSEDIYWAENPGVTDELAFYLKENFKKLRVIGFDFISATAYQNKAQGAIAHQAFLGDTGGPPILIVEDMSLINIKQGMDFESLAVAPWLIDRADGVPVTVMAKMRPLK